MDAKSELLSILNTMEIPDDRKDLDRYLNITWLSRNIGINNRRHPQFERANQLLRELWRQAKSSPA
jgi:hypothetical protein